MDSHLHNLQNGGTNVSKKLVGSSIPRLAKKAFHSNEVTLASPKLTTQQATAFYSNLTNLYDILELVVAGGLLRGPELGRVLRPVEVLLGHQRVQLGLEGAQVQVGGGRGRRPLLLGHFSLGKRRPVLDNAPNKFDVDIDQTEARKLSTVHRSLT